MPIWINEMPGRSGLSAAIRRRRRRRTAGMSSQVTDRRTLENIKSREVAGQGSAQTAANRRVLMQKKMREAKARRAGRGANKSSYTR